MQRKVKVCCFCERWESGGIESFLTNIMQHLDMERFQVDIVSACMKQSVFTQPLQGLGVRFFELSGKQRQLIGNYRRFFALLQQERYDVVHFNLFHGLSLVYAGIAKQVGVPMRIAHSHNTALRESAARPLKQWIHHIAKGSFAQDATDLWACSAAAAEFLFPKRVLAPKGYRFIPNGIETGRFRFDPKVREQVRAELGLEGKFVIGNVGRLCSQKNQDFLLDVFAQVKRQRPESCLLLVGEGELLEELKGKAGRLGITSSVIFYGVTPHVERLLWAMDVFAFPSRFEGLGIAAVEAQAAGLPTVCSEYVPDEAKMTGWARTVALSDGTHIWARGLLGQIRIDRVNAMQAVRDSGFDVIDVAAGIEAAWGKEKEIESASLS